MTIEILGEYPLLYQWAETGGFLGLMVIVGLILAAMSVFSLLIWLKSEREIFSEAFFKFLIFSVVCVAVFTGGLMVGVSVFPPLDDALFINGALVFAIFFTVALGLGLFWFVYDKFFKQEVAK